MMNIYCISGLGADKRIFSNIEIKGVRLVHIEWLSPDRNDTMSSYAKKISNTIVEEDPVIMGVSFGGMLATEIAKIRSVRKVFIISSAKCNKEKPHLPGFITKIITSGLFPEFLYTVPNPLIYYLFGVESHVEKHLLKDIVNDTNPALAKWSVSCILKWNNDIVSQSIVHIHGRRDKIIKAKNVDAKYWIDDGGHMMIYNRAGIVSKFVEQEIENL